MDLLGIGVAVPNFLGIFVEHLLSYFLISIKQKKCSYFILVLLFVCIAIILLLLSLELGSSGRCAIRDILGAPEGFEFLPHANT